MSQVHCFLLTEVCQQTHQCDVFLLKMETLIRERIWLDTEAWCVAHSCSILAGVTVIVISVIFVIIVIERSLLLFSYSAASKFLFWINRREGTSLPVQCQHTLEDASRSVSALPFESSPQHGHATSWHHTSNLASTEDPRFVSRWLQEYCKSVSKAE